MCVVSNNSLAEDLFCCVRSTKASKVRYFTTYYRCVLMHMTSSSALKLFLKQIFDKSCVMSVVHVCQHICVELNILGAWLLHVSVYTVGISL